MATTETTRPPVIDPVNETVRATVEASRRTIHSTQEAARFSRDLLEQSTGANRKLFAAYTNGMIAGLNATFAVQNAALSAGASVLETVTNSNRELAKQFTATANQAQQATTEAWQAGTRAADTWAAKNQQA